MAPPRRLEADARLMLRHDREGPGGGGWRTDPPRSKLSRVSSPAACRTFASLCELVATRAPAAALRRPDEGTASGALW